MQDALIVVPCYNEARRLDVERFLELSRAPGIRLLFVDDGSTDETGAIVTALAARSEGRIELLTLAKNAGKGEAVRQGLVHAAQGDAELIGFADSDLATPPEEILRLVDRARESGAAVVMASRVALAGTDIDRKAARHYLGRAFATLASLVLRARFYDTQCGAKLFKSSDLFRAAIAEPFHSRWIFDVELLGRLLAGAGGHPGLDTTDFLEVPLRRWADVAGSKLTASSWVRAGVDLAVIAAELERRRR
jgi:glycosyltransferase involved in cell wall biosynthesis